MKLIYSAKRRLDGLVDEKWMAGFDAYQTQNDRCPYPHGTEEFNSWVEGWIYAGQMDSPIHQSRSNKAASPIENPA
jgi:hypothetical protein